MQVKRVPWKDWQKKDENGRFLPFFSWLNRGVEGTKRGEGTKLWQLRTVCGLGTQGPTPCTSLLPYTVSLGAGSTLGNTRVVGHQSERWQLRDLVGLDGIWWAGPRWAVSMAWWRQPARPSRCWGEQSAQALFWFWGICSPCWLLLPSA